MSSELIYFLHGDSKGNLIFHLYLAKWLYLIRRWLQLLAFSDECMALGLMWSKEPATSCTEQCNDFNKIVIVQMSVYGISRFRYHKESGILLQLWTKLITNFWLWIIRICWLSSH